MNESTLDPLRSDRSASALPVIASIGICPSTTSGFDMLEDPVTTGLLDHHTAVTLWGFEPPPTTCVMTSIPQERPWVVTQLEYHRAAPGATSSRNTSDPEHPEPTLPFWSTQPAKDPKDLAEALGDLQEVAQEALEEGFQQPTETAVKNAARLVRAIFGVHPCRLEVYPTADGEIAIDAAGEHRGSVILLCAAAGGALCLVNTGNGSHRARYSEVDQLPDWFLSEALAELSRLNRGAA